MWMAIIWGIWNQRNCIILKNVVVDPIEFFIVAQMEGLDID